MAFLETTLETNSATSTLDKSDEATLTAPKNSKSSQESDARAAIVYRPHKELWKNLLHHRQTALNKKKDENTLEKRADLFSKAIADNQLQRDPKDWTLLKKKIFDLLFYYEQGNLTLRNNSATPFYTYKGNLA